MKISEISARIEAGKLTCVQLAQACLKRIGENDKAGKKLNAVAVICPDVLKEAEKIDEEIRKNGRRSPLHGVRCLISAGGRPQGNLAPISGSPCMTIPAVSQNGENFEPVSYYLVAGAFREPVLLHTAYILEDALQVRCRPSWAEDDFSMTF